MRNTVGRWRVRLDDLEVLKIFTNRNDSMLLFSDSQDYNGVSEWNTSNVLITPHIVMQNFK